MRRVKIGTRILSGRQSRRLSARRLRRMPRVFLHVRNAMGQQEAPSSRSTCETSLAVVPRSTAEACALPHIRRVANGSLREECYGYGPGENRRLDQSTNRALDCCSRETIVTHRRTSSPHAIQTKPWQYQLIAAAVRSNRSHREREHPCRCAGNMTPLHSECSQWALVC